MAEGNKPEDLGRMIAHDVNGKLAVILGRAQLMLTDDKYRDSLPRGVHEHLIRSLKSVEQSATDIQNLMRILSGGYEDTKAGVEFAKSSKLGLDEVVYKIVHIDDDPAIRLSFIQALTTQSNIIPPSSGVFGHDGKKVKYEVSSYPSVEEVLRELPGMQQVDILVTDREMPERDGYGLLDTLNQVSNKKTRRPEYQHVKNIAMLTGGVTKEEAEKAIETYLIAILTKPFKPLVLENQIYRTINPKAD